MASEVAQPDASHLNGNAIASPVDVVMTNGDHSNATTSEAQVADAIQDTSTTDKLETSIDSTGPVIDEVGPPISAPVEHVAPGITSVAGFLPKAVSTSHPTPPPDDLPVHQSATDTDMSNAIDASQPEPSSTESSLVRPREDDGELDGPVAKRTRMDGDADQDQTMTDAQNDPPAEPASLPPVAQPTEPEAATSAEQQAPDDSNIDVKPEPLSLAQASDAVITPISGGADASATVPTPSIEADPNPTTTAKPEPSAPATEAQPQPKYSTDTLTPLQTRFLQDKLKNLKKTKNSLPFINPVDPVALNIPTYRDIIKHPMDLTTMENKLKAGEYASVQAFVDDFDLIINNTRTFNGPLHAVTQTGASMEAYFRRMMEQVPNSDQVAAPKPVKRHSPAAQKPPSNPRRESRSINAPVAAVPPRPAAPTGETFALQPDGTPQIRRDSSINRPTRTIKPPANRELTYAKPKRKEHQLELKFCEHVLNQIRSPAYIHVNVVFQEPVDPVALNIPHYRQIIKHPMDLSTMNQKLKSGQYGKASEFKKDFDLMIENCLSFNPAGNPVRDVGIQFKREFEALWTGRQKWEATQKAASQRAGSDDESADEEEEEEEEEGSTEDAAETIRALQKQLADMQSALAGLNKPSKSKKSKSATKPSKKASAGSLSSKPKTTSSKPKPAKKPKQVTYEEKQEISEAVGKMTAGQIEDLTKIITNNCSKYADQEEMELEIDDLPNHVQIMLLDFVRRIFGNPKRQRAASPDDLAAMDDDDFEPAERGATRKSGNKRKKHKPMGKKEQQDTISTIQKQLAQFQNPVTSGSESPTGSSFPTGNQNADTSGDESDESEEE